MCKHTRLNPLAKTQEPPYTAAGQVEDRFVRRFTPAIEKKAREAKKPLKDSYKRQADTASAA